MCGMSRETCLRRTRANKDSFHAWQSSLLFSVIFILHVIFSWSKVISYMMLVGDLGLIGYLVWRAYIDGTFESQGPLKNIGYI